MIGPENTHRDPPFEAADYNLKAEGKKLEKFRANSKTELTVVVEDSSEQENKKEEHSILELPVDFSKDDVSGVRYIFTFG